MINTLKELVESINENLKAFEGTNVSGPLDVCREVKQQIQADKFYEDLRKNNLEDLIVFEDAIDRLDYVSLRMLAILDHDQSLKSISQSVILTRRIFVREAY